MAMTTLVLHPLDTLFFRDGRPYNQDDPTQAEAASVFPPYPPITQIELFSPFMTFRTGPTCGGRLLSGPSH